MTVSSNDTLQETQWLSDRISSQVRLVAAGVLAVCWSLLLSPPKSLIIDPRTFVWVALLALLTMMVDLAQYIFGYLFVLQHHRRLIREQIELGYDRTAKFAQLRRGMFWSKQVLATASFTALVLVLLPDLLSRP